MEVYSMLNVILVVALALLIVGAILFILVPVNEAVNFKLLGVVLMALALSVIVIVAFRENMESRRLIISYMLSGV